MSFGWWSDRLRSRWRAVPVLGVTQVIAWGSIFYTPVLMAPLIAQARGWSIAFCMAGFSAGLLTAGLVAPLMGRSIDRFGGHVTMAVGSLIGAAGLCLLVASQHQVAYLLSWSVLGIAMSATLYDAAFATLGRIFGRTARRPITMLTLIGGFASTASWPVTQALNSSLGWETTYLIYAGLMLCVAVPLHAFALPRTVADVNVATPVIEEPVISLPPTIAAKGWPLVLVAIAFAAYAFVPSGISAHLLAILGRAGLDAETVVMVGAAFGPAQVAARLVEFLGGRSVHPLTIVRGALVAMVTAFVMLAVLGITVLTATVFAILFGGANGLMTIGRGALPLALFGSSGYGKLLGTLSAPFLIMQAVAPLVLAVLIEHVSDAAALALAGAFAAFALMSFLLIRQPRPHG